jgi:glycerol-3-phosphate acyltransferase PlsY
MDLLGASVLSLLIAYLLGGIPFGLVLAWLLARVDIRKIGSGNVGATNAARAFPRPWSLLVFLLIYLLDFAKGFAPAFWIADALCGGSAPLSLRVSSGAVAVLGHCFSPYLRFHGGKGVATACGAVAAIDPLALLVALAVFGLVFAATRVVAIGSLALGVALALAIVLRDPESAFSTRLPATAFGFGIAAFLFFTHRDNIRRLLAARRA